MRIGRAQARPVHRAWCMVEESDASPSERARKGPMPGLQLPSKVASVLRDNYTAEVTTVNRQGQPLSWPSLTYFDEANGQIFLTVAIAFPVKAFNARRHPQVSLLYSDPTGSTLADPPAVLVQGTATVAEVLDLGLPQMRAVAKL